MRKSSFVLLPLLFGSAYGAEALVAFSRGNNFGHESVGTFNSNMLSVQAYPAGKIKWLGVFYSFEMSNDVVADDPFFASRRWQSHAIGPILRLTRKSYEPWLASGLSIRSESARIFLFDEVLLDSHRSRKSAFLECGVNIMIWEGLFVAPAVSLSGVSRPVPRVALGVGWRFKGKMGRR
ncbi:MAG: hypothetical protein HY506_02430 [Candidatus Yanofskybacteria bacterium]|nr:hypothetical protein [Candidatus Yanofskybacteria bacterium]